MKKRMLKKRKKISDSVTIRLDSENFSERSGTILVGASSIVGTRENQQDSYNYENIPFKDYVFAIVCDGMGGLEGGRTASKIAVDSISEQFRDIVDEHDPRIKMMQAANKANEIVAGLKNENGMPMKAGTTMAATIIKNGLLHWVSVGDSKIYLLKAGRFTCLTNEHNYTFLAEQKKDDRNFIYDPNVRRDALVSYLGTAELAYIDINQEPVQLEEEDSVLVCSDGLYKSLSEEQIVSLLLNINMEPEEIARRLTSEALKWSKGSQDNTTAVVLRYRNI